MVFYLTMSLNEEERISLPVRSHVLQEGSQRDFRITWSLEIWILFVTGAMRKTM